jgi:hypothetical protein
MLVKHLTLKKKAFSGLGQSATQPEIFKGSFSESWQVS